MFLLFSSSNPILCAILAVSIWEMVSLPCGEVADCTISFCLATDSMAFDINLLANFSLNSGRSANLRVRSLMTFSLRSFLSFIADSASSK